MRHSNQPYNRTLFDKILKDELSKSADISIQYVSHAFKSVAVVGMLLPDLKGNSDDLGVRYDGKENVDPYIDFGLIQPQQLCRDDLAMLRTSLSQFSQAGIPLHPTAQFHIYNLLPPIGSDFLLNAHGSFYDEDAVNFPKTDLVIVNYLPRHGYTPDNYRDYDTSDGFSALTASEFCAPKGNSKLVSVSRLHRHENIWPTAAFNAGAKFISVHGGTQDEVTTNDMREHPESVVLICSDETEQEYRKARRYDRVTGVVGNKNAMQNYAPHINKKSALGQALLRSLG